MTIQGSEWANIKVKVQFKKEKEKRKGCKMSCQLFSFGFRSSCFEQTLLDKGIEIGEVNELTFLILVIMPVLH